AKRIVVVTRWILLVQRLRDREHGAADAAAFLVVDLSNVAAQRRTSRVERYGDLGLLARRVGIPLTIESEAEAEPRERIRGIDAYRLPKRGFGVSGRAAGELREAEHRVGMRETRIELGGLLGCGSPAAVVVVHEPQLADARPRERVPGLDSRCGFRA